jgi:hypothetical protein
VETRRTPAKRPILLLSQAFGVGKSFFSACSKHGDSNEQEEKGDNCCDSLFHDCEPLFRDAFVEIGGEGVG